MSNAAITYDASTLPNKNGVCVSMRVRVGPLHTTIAEFRDDGQFHPMGAIFHFRSGPSFRGDLATMHPARRAKFLRRLHEATRREREALRGEFLLLNFRREAAAR